MQDWPSLNQVVLIGKVGRVKRIQWADGSTTAWFNLATRKMIATPDGFRRAYDHHEVEVSPGERFFKDCWEGAIVMIRGEYESFEWTPRGATAAFNRHVVMARGLQLVLPSAKPRSPIDTVFRAHRKELEPTTRRHSHERTDASEG